MGNFPSYIGQEVTVRDEEWLRFVSTEDVLCFDSTPPRLIDPSNADQDEDNQEEEDEDDGYKYCGTCNSYDHSDSDCPVLHPELLASSAPTSTHILSSSDASLMEGLIDDDIVRKSFLVSLSSDLLKQTQETSSAHQEWNTKQQLLAHIHAALRRVRARQRLSQQKPRRDTQEAPLATLRPFDTVAGQPKNTTAKPTGKSGSAALLLRMCVTLLQAAASASTQSPITTHILDTLQTVLQNPKALTLTSVESAEWSESVVSWLVAVVSGKKHDYQSMGEVQHAVTSSSSSSSASADSEEQQVHRRAVLLLLNLVLQTGSPLTVLKIVHLLGLAPQSSLSRPLSLSQSDYQDVLKAMFELRPDSRLLSSFDSLAPLLVEWAFMFPNVTSQELLEDQSADGQLTGRIRTTRTGRAFSSRPNRNRGRKMGIKDKEKEKDSKPPGFAHHISIANNGQFLYVLDTHYGLAKVGSGLNGTRAGHIYEFKPHFAKDEVAAHIAWLDGVLYMKTAKSKTHLTRINQHTLDIMDQITLPDEVISHLHSFSPLIACHRYLYVFTHEIQHVLEQDVNVKVDKFEIVALSPSSSSTDSLSVARRVPLVCDPADARSAQQCYGCDAIHYLGASPASQPEALCSYCSKCGFGKGAEVSSNASTLQKKRLYQHLHTNSTGTRTHSKIWSFSNSCQNEEDCHW